MQKKIYSEPRCEVILMKMSDVIVTSPSPGGDPTIIDNDD